MVECQNVLSAIMINNVKLSNENVRLHLATPEILKLSGNMFGGKQFHISAVRVKKEFSL